MIRLLAAMLLTVSAAVALAAPIQHTDGNEERRFRALTGELRCVMCQNQSLADSSAPIARDLRLEVLRLMRDGKTDAEIKQYLVERYSDFVLYQPRVKPSTWLLWFGPGVLIAGGALAITFIVRRQSRNAPALPPANDRQEW